MKEKTLLEKAKVAKRQVKPGKMTDEHIELALAWVNGEINLRVVNIALDKPPGSTYVYIFLTHAMKDYLLKTKQ